MKADKTALHDRPAFHPYPAVGRSASLPPIVRIATGPAVIYEPPRCTICHKLGEVADARYPLQIPANYAISSRVFSDARGSHGAWGTNEHETFVTVSMPLMEFLSIYEGHLAGPCARVGQAP